MKTKAKSFCIRFAVLLLVLAGTMAFLSCMSKAPENIGLQNGKLADCPSSPNCVCSQQDKNDEEHFIDSLPFSSSPALALEKIKTALNEIPRTKIVSETENYLHVECTSLIFRFTDDLEIFIDESSKQIHFRSASRVGHSDLGVNRKRVNKLKERLKGL